MLILTSFSTLSADGLTRFIEFHRLDLWNLIDSIYGTRSTRFMELDRLGLWNSIDSIYGTRSTRFMELDQLDLWNLIDSIYGTRSTRFMELDRLDLWNLIDSVFRWINSICGTHRFGLQNSINSVSETNPSPGVLTPPSRAAPHCPEHAQCNNHPVKAHATLAFFASL